MLNRVIRCGTKSGTEFIILSEAEDDIADILQYTGHTWGEEQQIRYLSALWDAFKCIQEFPDIRRRRPDLEPSIRELYLTRHTIVYRREPARVSILRVINPRRLR